MSVLFLHSPVTCRNVSKGFIKFNMFDSHLANLSILTVFPGVEVSEIFDLCINSGFCISDLHKLNKSRRVSCRSEPITQGLNISLIRPPRSRHFPDFNFDKTFEISSLVHIWVFTFQASSMIRRPVSSFILIKKSFISVCAVCLFLNICLNFLKVICSTADVFVIISL